MKCDRCSKKPMDFNKKKQCMSTLFIMKSIYIVVSRAIWKVVDGYTQMLITYAIIAAFYDWISMQKSKEAWTGCGSSKSRILFFHTGTEAYDWYGWPHITVKINISITSIDCGASIFH